VSVFAKRKFEGQKDTKKFKNFNLTLTFTLSLSLALPFIIDKYQNKNPLFVVNKAP